MLLGLYLTYKIFFDDDDVSKNRASDKVEETSTQKILKKYKKTEPRNWREPWSPGNQFKSTGPWDTKK
jgi:hypothetical protein